MINCSEEVTQFEVKDMGKKLNFSKRVVIFLLRNQTNGRKSESEVFRQREGKLNQSWSPMIVEFLILLF